MPILKQIGKGAAVLRHSSSVDNEVSNTAQGSTLAASQELDNGFSYAPSNVGDPGGTLAEFASYYPSPQMPSFRDLDTVNKRPTDDWSEKMSYNVIYPWISASVRTPRSETYTIKSSLRVVEMCGRYSYFRPVGQAVDQDNAMIICQMHGGASSPPFTISEENGGWITIRIWTTSSTRDQTRFYIKELTRGVWHNITIFSRWVNGTDATATGRHLIFVDNKIARTYTRSGSPGSYTYTKAQVPRVTGGTGGIETLNTEFLGNLPIQIVEDDVTTDLLFFKGRTLGDAVNFTSFQFKWGVYKSSLGSTYYNNDATITSLLGGGASWEEAVLVNPDNPAGAKYILPEVRTGILNTSVCLGVVGAGETYEYMFRQLNDGLNIDAGDRAIIAANPELSWFTLDIAPDYDLTVGSNNVLWGGVTRSPLSNPVAQGSSVTVTAVSEDGYSFFAWRKNSISGEIMSINPIYTFSMPSEELTLIAVFTSSTPIPPTGDKFFAKSEEPIV